MSDFAVWNEFGHIYMKLGAYDEAIAAYRRATELAPQWGSTYGYLATAYSQKGDFSTALSFYQKAIELSKDEAEKVTLWNKLGDTYRRLNDYEGAMQAYRYADELDHKLRAMPFPPISLATPPQVNAPSTPATSSSLLSREEKPSAISPSASAPSTPPPSARPSRISSYLVTGKTAASGQAIDLETDVLDRPLPASPLPQLERSSNKATATAFIAAAVGAGSNVLAEKTSEQLSPAQESPPSTQADQATCATLANLSDSNQTTAGIERNTSLYKRITDVNPNNDRAWDTLGLSLKALGRYEEAIGAFRQAIALRPDREVYHYHLGLVYAAQKRHHEAVEEFRQVVALNPNYVLAHGALAGSCRRLGLHEEAEQHIRIALPHMQSENEYNRACFEAICGNADQAIALLKIALEKKQTTLEWMRCDPDLDSLRSDSRFKALIQTGNESR